MFQDTKVNVLPVVVVVDRLPRPDADDGPGGVVASHDDVVGEKV